MDVLSGSRPDRSQYVAMLAEARRLAASGRTTAIVVARLDRFGRSVLERARCAEELRALGVPIHSACEGGLLPGLVSDLLAAVAQEEVRRLGEHLLVQVVGLEDLIRLKRAAGRGKDLVDVAALEEIRALRDEPPR